jgi:uncharacterized protein YgfB (UPF0149 family)
MTHADLAASLARMNITVDASEAHGWLAGALCVRDGYGPKEWLAELAADSGGSHPPPDADVQVLPAATLAAFRSDDFEFAPLLPKETAPLGERVAALAAWSGGFLYGIGTGASEAAIAKAGDVGEFLRDLADIARAELEPGREADAGEGDFAELSEFVRAGAQLAFDEFEGMRAHAKG